jgi:uncharacterized protein (DUF2236 family)
MWRINREAVLLGVGPAALLLQIAHPQVAQGVAEHSDFLADPWKRLRGTMRTTMDLVFGDGPCAEAAVRRLNSIHAGVRGETYRALDPDLLLWVQSTLIVTSMQAHERWVGPVPSADREAFWAEARDVGRRIGIPLSRSPADWPALEAYWARMLAPDGPIHVTATARRLAPSIFRPPMPWLPTTVVDLLTTPGLALLPPRLRDEFGIAWGPGREALASAFAIGLRAWTRVVPSAWRAMPQARAAERRARAARRGGVGSPESSRRSLRRAP